MTLPYRPARCLLPFLLPLSLAAQALEGLVFTREVGPGVKHHRWYRAAGPWAIEVVAFDYHHPALRLETVRAADKGLELTSRMASRAESNSSRVVAALNGDFFTPQGRPLNLQISNGEIVNGSYPRSVLAVSRSGEPVIAITELSGKVITRRAGSHPLAGINRERGENEIILYNRFFGSHTNTNRHGREVALRLLTTFTVNDSVATLVMPASSASGNSALSDSVYVLSAHGTAANWLARAVAAGDTIKLFWQLPQIPLPVRAAIGGTPRLIRDGKISIESEIEFNRAGFATERHPRSAVGFDEKNHRMYFVVVDGRQPGYSVGMTLAELANFLSELGCTQAINLDGGGSSTLVVRGEVVNRPSDLTGERPVANALLLLCSAQGTTPAYLKISPPRVEALAGDSVRFRISLTDSFFNPIAIAPAAITWRVPPALGKNGANGIFWAGTKVDSGFVVVTNGVISDSAWVVVHQPAGLELHPPRATVKPGQAQRFLGYLTTTSGRRLPLAGPRLSWQVQPQSGTVTAGGTVVATTPGTYRVTATYQSTTATLTASAEVTVETGGKQP
ncbi:MAG: phosphodiester glycosidase family protein [candidate division KSB1 bacterium]|nr:phosphodiester glycosidase family protein [candidate division KSB1 bacterium]MDZ7273711.1 phosphodiester glycosidase family protein [candidate division KSB1 bacterium]MDZ7285867.1 phosphodiester glycosidase family protein [candidate division KSB1 bacterium]MDZ7298899.1 phosphodiester glycosidase family protein [candidate division KSB1 bacterium]MDZ7309593.1 phosphodiester glycosidase family protein [candidate division KSB1 bacterium]